MNQNTHHSVRLPPYLRPIHCEHLLSIGGSSGSDQADGNYVLTQEALEATEVLVSFGINDDWSFEAAVREQTGAEVHAYDQSTRDRFLKRLSLRRYRHYRRQLKSALAYLRCLALDNDKAKLNAIGSNLRRGYFPRKQFLDFFDGRGAFFYPEFIGPRSMNRTSVLETLEAHQQRRVMLKMDIEGSEYQVHEELMALPSNVHVFLAEYHGLHRPDHLEMLRAFSESSHLKLIHVHANNCAQPVDDVEMPPVLELTFISEEYFQPSGSSPLYPIEGLDVTNDPDAPDFALTFA